LLLLLLLLLVLLLPSFSLSSFSHLGKVLEFRKSEHDYQRPFILYGGFWWWCNLIWPCVSQSCNGLCMNLLQTLRWARGRSRHVNKYSSAKVCMREECSKSK
jgi:hypothetical protein